MFDNRIPGRGVAACPLWFPIASLWNRLVWRRVAAWPCFPLSRRDLDGAEPEPKRAKRVIERATKVWISLDGFKICTRTSDDLWEAINWHIMLVRMKQLFDERIKAGQVYQ